MNTYFDIPHRLVGKALYESYYDHFGQMDILSDGSLYLIYRRATEHVGGSDGRVVFSKLEGGIWSAPTIVAQAGGQDFRDVAGGTMPSGRIVAASTVYETGEVKVYVSDDSGVTWVHKFTLARGGADYNFAHGKSFQVGARYVIPLYAATGVNYELKWLESSDGGETWGEGSTIYSGNTPYNETSYLPVGDGVILAVARVGSGAGGALRQFISLDDGGTWTDQGNVTAQNGDSTDILVAPSLSYIYSEGGTPHVVLLYTNRTTHFCYYRTILLAKAVAGSSGWTERVPVYSAPAASGYTSQVVLGGRRILGNLFRETSSTTSGAYQFEVYLGGVPDFESDWFSVSSNSLYTLSHGLQRSPRRVVVEFARSSSPSTWNIVMPSYFNDGGHKGSGAQVEVGSLNIRLGTGAAVWGTGYFGGIDNSATTRFATGYYRVRAWI
ncbi:MULTISPECIES: sialidase family protein [Pseudomonas]|jgi:BNR/Asp-box repeat.|uniref:exo-alpha-sialidase n=14 Tax=Pseudomonas aeruginosa TaxID=287 RepID=G3XCV3_PSEAE|nr:MULTISPECIES: sialidase family protein [Pseudomonas]2W38_A Chain A, Sialidase [Pseudomonas aeruginosa PAO1]MDG0899270.1 sialidase family protein [Pseudomonas sp. L01]HCL2712596.1 exo-alpha-sialidase [Pseudomonas aeruginosa EF8E]AAF60322.2 sialidase [Pseudomonas aeruginosa]AAG06182.1 pseudaminidase [Pseudomonas aeruginosa PAO1]AGV58004.1 BNR repeat-like domain protein [Pseudomonas aeruginosa PAO581]